MHESNEQVNRNNKECKQKKEPIMPMWNIIAVVASIGFFIYLIVINALNTQ